MDTIRKTLVTLTMLVIGLCGALQPMVASAQNSGVGSDGLMRFLWRGTDNRISLWRMDGALNQVDYKEYGPYDSWIPWALTTNTSTNLSFLLWRNTSGQISIWRLDNNLNFVNDCPTGPFPGWLAETITAENNFTNRIRIAWKHTSGRLSVWIFDTAQCALILAHEHGPYFGYDPGSPSY
jgi:hypothetical protein